MNTAIEKVAHESVSGGESPEVGGRTSGALGRRGEGEGAERGPVVMETAPRERRSVFGNYVAAAGDEGWAGEGEATLGGGGERGREAVEKAVARAFVHQYLARAFDYPTLEVWAWMRSAEIQVALGAAVRSAAAEGTVLRRACDRWAGALREGEFEAFHDDYIAAIGHAARGSCPANEIEYGDLKADPLFQPHRLADLGAFYRAFGLEVGEGSGERQDHVSVELEFLGVLAAQEASALRGGVEGEGFGVVQTAQRRFLREHVGRWTPAFARRLHRAVGDTALGALALFTLAWIEQECGRCGVTPGSEDLLLRPADEEAAMCDGCGLASGLPGAPGAEGGGAGV